MTGAARGGGSRRIRRRARFRASGSLGSPARKQHRKGDQQREAAAQQGEAAVGRALRQLAKQLVVFPALGEKSGDGGELCLLLERAHRGLVHCDKEIGRASCRERVESRVGGGEVKKKKEESTSKV